MCRTRKQASNGKLPTTSDCVLIAIEITETPPTHRHNNKTQFNAIVVREEKKRKSIKNGKQTRAKS